MNRHFYLALLIFSSVMLFAQPGSNRTSKENVFARKWDFLSTQVALNAVDEAKVHSLFLEYEEQIWQLYAGNREIFRIQRRRQPQQKVDFETINDAMVEAELTKARLQKEYYLKLKKVLDAETINKLFHAEKAYQRQLVQRIPDRFPKVEGQGQTR